MRTRSHSPGPNRAAVSLAWSTAHSLDSGSFELPIPHPVVQQDRLGGGHVHNHHLVLPVPPVLAWDLWDEQDVHWLPWPKPNWVVVDRRIMLSEDVAWYILWHLKCYLIYFIDPHHVFVHKSYSGVKTRLHTEK